MKKYKFGLFTLCLFLLSANLNSQHITDLRINEMLINNVDNFDDEYGRHVPWIEIFNTAYNSVDIGGCFLTNDTTGFPKGEGNWYRIPTGDTKTIIPKRSFIIFYLDNAPLYGTFHVNFDPRDEGSSNYIALISSNGKTLIDVFEFPDSLRYSTMHSYGYFDDGVKEIQDEDGNWISNKGFLDHFTPGSPNKSFDGLTKSEKLAKDDPYGIGLILISMFTVFSALFIIYLLMKIFAQLSKKKILKSLSRKEVTANEREKKPALEKSITKEEVAAAIMALHLYFEEAHEEESEIITIETPFTHYSPWSQKHLSLKRVQRKK